MKNIQRFTAFIVAITLLLSACPPPSIAEASTSTSNEMRGLWVASVLNLDYPSKATTDSETLKKEAISVLDKAQQAGLNAVFLQVRPTSDALYPSKYFPWSKYLTGRQGVAPTNNFDPLAFWVDEAHKRGIQLHAWINPYRITKKLAKETPHDFASLAAEHPANLHPEWVVKHSDGNLYFDPGLPEVRQYIIDSSMEIVQNYAVDGIHFDDYFYPGQTFNDAATYKNYGASFKSIHDWRRDNVTLLIQGMSQALKQSGKKVAFGISPFGIWANKSKNPLGSDTNGLQSYSDHYADTRKWVKDNTIDYIAPQLYWNIGFKVADYAKLLTWWKNTTSGTQVKLYIGQALYRTGSSDVTSPWYGVDEIKRQLDLNAATQGVSGSIFYNYSSLKKSASLVNLLSSYYENSQSTAVIPVTPSVVSVVPSTPTTPVIQVQPTIAVQPAQNLTIARPANNVKTTYAAYFISGTSDPNQPLLVNGTSVENRSSKGYFGYYAKLNFGKNTLVFSQGTNKKTLTLTRVAPVVASKTMARAEIPASSTFPQSQEMRLAGEKVTLSCTAPVGSTVTAQVNGATYDLKPDTATSSTSGIVPTRFTYSFTMPEPIDSSAPSSLGKILYTMTYQGVTVSRTSPAELSALSQGTAYYAEISKDFTDTYTTASTSNGSNAELYLGMKDRITGMSGPYLKLNAGLWIKKENARISGSESTFSPTVTSTQYTPGEKWDTLSLSMTQIPAAAMTFDGSKLTLTMSGSNSAGSFVQLPDNSLFDSITTEAQGNKLVYTLKLKAGQSLSGYILKPTSTSLNLEIKRKPLITNAARPLEGLTILLDPGHGGSDPGALGPLGKAYAENNINLNLALKMERILTDLGARVEMTRRTDEKLALADRVTLSRNLRPDLFVSLHANSLEDSADLNKVSGFSVYYNKTGLSKTLSDTLFQRVINDLGRKNRGVHTMNFYVTKTSWTPSLLVESGFVPNPIEFEWLTDDAGSQSLAQKLSEGIVSYFSQP